MNCEIIAVGSELLTPWRQDTNSLFLTEELNAVGASVRFKTIVGDRRTDLAGAVRTALTRADILIVMGGLGPTEDDLSRESVAEALGVTLQRDGSLVAALSARFAARRMTMTDNNLKQADVMEGAEVLVNPNGTAPGQWIDTEWDGFRKLVMLIPGPPGECRPLFEEQCLPRLRAVIPERHIARRTLKATMIGESAADALLAPIYGAYPDVETTILAGNCEIQLHLACAKTTLEAAKARVDDLAGKLEEALDEYLFASQGETLEQIVLFYLELKQATLSVAESCTGGMLGERITSIAGSSRSFVGGALVYSDALKIAFCGVEPELIAEHGAVSAPVAEAMSHGIRRRTGATFGIGITGVAGPGGGTEEKPVGLVYIALSDAQNTECSENNFRGDRQKVRQWATQKALDMLRRRLIQYR